MAESIPASLPQAASAPIGKRRSAVVAGACAGGVGVLGAGLSATLARGGLHWDQEMALFPWLISQGWVLYRDLRDQHPPLLPAALGLLPDPGAPGPQLVFTVALVAVTLALAAVAAWRTAGPVAGLGAAGLYALWQVPFGGAHLWYDLALGPFYLGAYLLARTIPGAPERVGRLAALGLLLGAACLVKQQAALALLAGLVLAAPATARRLGAYLGGAALPVLGSVLAFGAAGALGDYLYWAGTYNLTSSYAREGAAPVPAGEWPVLAAVYAPVLALALSALLPAPGVRRATWGGEMRLAIFATGLLLAATLPAWPRYDRFHLAAALPLLAVAGGVAAANLLRGWPGRRGRALLPWALAALLLLVSLRFTGPAGGRGLAAIWQRPAAPLPFAASAAPLRAWLATTTWPGTPVLVYDLDPTLGRVIGHPPPRPWTPLFPWILEGDSTAAQWMAGITAARPPVVLVSVEFVAGRHLPLADGGQSEAFLRATYVAGPHFTIQKYPDSGPQEIVALTLR